MPDFLIAFHVPANAGYAVEPLERTFFSVISQLLSAQQSGGRIHLGYNNFKAGKPKWLGSREVPLLELDFRKMSAAERLELRKLSQAKSY